MDTINAIKVKRRNAIRTLKRELRSIDSQVEALQRLVNRILARKDKIPERNDLNDIFSLFDILGDRVIDFNKQFANVETIFNV